MTYLTTALSAIRERLDGFAACNLSEPTADDLPRIYAAYKECFAERARLIKALEKCVEQRDEWIMGASEWSSNYNNAELAAILEGE